MREGTPNCPECDEDEDYDVELLFTAGGGMSSDQSPWDEPGTAHREEDTNTVHYYRCSNDHRWTEEK